MTRGKFITLEGSEGVGKSTQCGLLGDCIVDELGHELVTTREPGGSQLGESVRAILLDNALPEMENLTELLLLFAARSEHLEKVIKPALAANKWVLCDRFTDTSYAYQGGGRRIDRQTIATLETLVQDEFRPDLTIVLDLPVDVAFRRVDQRGTTDRFEQERRSFFERVRSTYLELANVHPHRMIVVDANPPIAAVQDQIRQIVRDRLT
jgi:dTMP kinase